MHAAVHLVLRDADPTGIVTATRDNWTGKAYAMPIRDFAEMRDLMGTAGVYVLVGEDDTNTDDVPIIYIGEAETVRDRLRPGHHQLARTDVTWQRVVIFISQADDLHKGHVKWLESQLVQQARLAAKWRVANVGTPTAPKLPEFDEVFVRSFLANMGVLYPLLGVRAFQTAPSRPLPETAIAAADTVATRQEQSLQLERGGVVVATGHVTTSGFVLHAGSLIRKRTTDSVGVSVAALRNLWAETGAATEQDDDNWKLTHDIEVSSSSTAARAVHGRAASGPELWMSNGRRLRDIQAGIAAGA